MRVELDLNIKKLISQTSYSKRYVVEDEFTGDSLEISVSHSGHRLTVEYGGFQASLRELEVLKEFVSIQPGNVDGKHSYKRASENLGITKDTVKNHLTNIRNTNALFLEEHGLSKNTTGVVIAAHTLGLLHPAMLSQLKSLEQSLTKPLKLQ